MRITWMVTAQAVRKIKGAGMDVANIFDQFLVDTFPATFSFVVLAKVVSEPSDDIATVWYLRLQVVNAEKKVLYDKPIQYSPPTFQEWIDGAAPYFLHALRMTMKEPGVYYLLLGKPGEEKTLAEAAFLVDVKGEGE